MTADAYVDPSAPLPEEWWIAVELDADPPASNGDHPGGVEGQADILRRQILDIAALRRLKPPTPLVRGLLDLDSLVVLYGPPGAGKSVVALDLALRVASGTRWHGHNETRSGSVLYVAAEGAHGLAARVDAWKAATATIHDPRLFGLLPVAVNLLDPRKVVAVAGYVAEVEPVLVVIDTLARCTVGAEENSSRDMSMAVDALDQIRSASGACVVAVHHSGKNLDAGARGHTALLGAADTVLRVTSSERILTLDQEKQKHHELGHRQTYRLASTAESVALEPFHGSTADDLTTKTVVALEALAAIEEDEGVSYTRWKGQAVELGVSETSLDRARKILIDRGLVTPIPSAGGRSKYYALTDEGRTYLPPSDADAESAP